jgi:hypothetical protein
LQNFRIGNIDGITLYVPVKLLDQVIFDTIRTINLLALTIIFISAVLLLISYLQNLKVEEIELLYQIIRKLNLSKKETGIEIPRYTETPTE